MGYSSQAVIGRWIGALGDLQCEVALTGPLFCLSPQGGHDRNGRANRLDVGRGQNSPALLLWLRLLVRRLLQVILRER